MAYQIIGNTVVEWEDEEPLKFSISENNHQNDKVPYKKYSLDISALRQGFDEKFLINFKQHIIERGYQIALITQSKECKVLKTIFLKVISYGIFDKKISSIDESFLLAICTIDLTYSDKKYLRLAFSRNPESLMFAKNIIISDFPKAELIKGRHGTQIDHILAKALSRSACVKILTICEDAYDQGEMSISHFSFVNLGFSVFSRPSSYYRILVEDFTWDNKSDSYFIFIRPVKTGVDIPDKLCYKINQTIGILLQKQRQHVVSTYGHLVKQEEVGKLALFPCSQLTKDKSAWVSDHANKNFGQFSTSEHFAVAYPKKIQD